MAVKIQQHGDTNVLVIHVEGKLTKEDYDHFVPRLEEQIQQFGKVRILLNMRDFHGWEMSALWEDLKFDLKHFGDIERLAMVGDSQWEKGMALFCKPFTKATIRYFDVAKEKTALEWVSAEPAVELADVDMNDLTRVYTLNDAGLAEIICNALRAEGIPSFVGDELQAAMTGIWEVDILVRAIDADRARAFIRQHEAEHKATI